MMIKKEINYSLFEQFKMKVHFLFCNEALKPVNTETANLLSETHSIANDTVSFSDPVTAVHHLDSIINKKQGGMRIHYRREFIKEFEKIPLKIQISCRNRIKLFSSDPFHSQLHNHALIGDKCVAKNRPEKKISC